MQRFLLNSPDGRETRAAIAEILDRKDGNRLSIVTGFLGARTPHAMPELPELKRWLQADKNRHLLLVFGFWGRFLDGSDGVQFAPDKDAEEELMRNAWNLFPAHGFPFGLAEQISVYGVRNLHVKAIALSRIDGQQRQTLAGIVGSSNFTGAALHGRYRFEMDFYMSAELGQRCALLEDFRSRLTELLESALPHSDARATEAVERQVLKPAREQIIAEWLDDMSDKDQDF